MLTKAKQKQLQLLKEVVQGGKITALFNCWSFSYFKGGIVSYATAKIDVLGVSERLDVHSSREVVSAMALNVKR
jgi:nicotinamide mononucleotide (NMN) deamidase PncC